jgi:copper chaperone
MEERMDEITYTVAGMSCGHCEEAVRSELGNVAGVAVVEVDLESKRVAVRGEGLEDKLLREAIAEAGYQAA